MARAHPPIWLARPGGFAGLPRPCAVAVTLALLVLVSLFALATPSSSSDNAGFADVSLYETVIDGMRVGGGYYQLLADSLRASGAPLRPFLTFRLPTHAAVQALLPREGVVLALFLLASGGAVAWWVRLAEALPGAMPRTLAMILLAGGLVGYLIPDLVGVHEMWAGLLIALSLALRRPRRWVEAVAVGLIAALVRETAALYLLVMLAFALVDGARREAIGWGAALGLLSLVLSVHAFAVAQVTGPLDARVAAATALLGPGVVVAALGSATVLQLLPSPLPGLIAALALAGWSGWRDPLGSRVAATLGSYALAAALFADGGSFYWVLMIAPLWLVGLVFVPDMLRDLGAAVLDRPRVRVQRITP